MSVSKLFLSVDLVGSTAVKSRGDEGWQRPFLSFYRGFPQTVAQLSSRDQSGDSLSFSLWKAIGDELVFEVPVSSCGDIARAVCIWLEAMRTFDQDVLNDQSDDGRRLSVKGSAFLATFGSPDSEVAIPRDPRNEDSSNSELVLNQQALASGRDMSKYQFDYIGPSFDTGFRLATFASTRIFVLSVEVALALASAFSNAKTAATGTAPRYELSEKDLVFLGQKELKGVWGGRPYPVFGIDRHRKDPVNWALRELNGGSLKAAAVLEVCKACVNSPEWPGKPYLPNDNDGLFHPEPANLLERMAATEVATDGLESIDESKDGEDLMSDAPLGDLSKDPIP